ncbi:uncharacterized protein V6R79_010392 [Siganus canaliculatus]
MGRFSQQEATRPPFNVQFTVKTLSIMRGNAFERCRALIGWQDDTPADMRNGGRRRRVFVKLKKT